LPQALPAWNGDPGTSAQFRRRLIHDSTLG
jgi:hypothetical protein